MWLMTRTGFYSIVQHSATHLVVRARVKADLVRLCQQLQVPARRIAATPGRDYPYRLVLPRHQVAMLIEEQVAGIDYPNFKAQVRQALGQVRELLYHRVWALLTALEPPRTPHWDRVAGDFSTAEDLADPDLPPDLRLDPERP